MDGWNAVRTGHFNLVVTDIEMPNIDGFLLTSSIRANPRLVNIPVLIVSSRASEEDHQRGLDAGADGYIVKTSFDEAGLLNAVSRLLGRTAAATERRPSGAIARFFARARDSMQNRRAGPDWSGCFMKVRTLREFR